jgi:hypothetical protein
MVTASDYINQKITYKFGCLVKAFTRINPTLIMAIKKFEQNRKATPKSDS